MSRTTLRPPDGQAHREEDHIKPPDDSGDRGRKIRWVLGLLRPYLKRIFFMVLAVIAASLTSLTPASSPGTSPPWSRS